MTWILNIPRTLFSSRLHFVYSAVNWNSIIFNYRTEYIDSANCKINKSASKQGNLFTTYSVYQNRCNNINQNTNSVGEIEKHQPWQIYFKLGKALNMLKVCCSRKLKIIGRVLWEMKKQTGGGILLGMLKLLAVSCEFCAYSLGPQLRFKFKLLWNILHADLFDISYKVSSQEFILDIENSVCYIW